MDPQGALPHLAFWTAALCDLLAVVACAGVGVRRVRRGDVAGHRRLMLTGAALIGLFLVSYGVKVAALGREDRSLWDRPSLLALYVHETCVAVMLLAGGYALYRALRFRRDLAAGGPAALDPRARAHHRRAGRAAVAASALAFATASAVLVGMYARAG